jgi:hypothetical protein
MSKRNDWEYLGPAFGKPGSKKSNPSNDKRFMGEVVLALFLLAMLGMCSAGGG